MKYAEKRKARESTPEYRARAREKQRLYRLAHPDRIRASERRYIVKHRDECRERCATYRKKNVAAGRVRDAKYAKEHREQRRAYQRQYRAQNVQFRVSLVLRSRLATAVRNGARGGSAVRDLGCSIAELMQYLATLFRPGMTWENWGRSGWHIDHIRPLAGFDLTDPEQVKIACHFTNLQPMWASENMSKGAR